MADPIWFWQRIVSPHMAGLASALAASGRDVVYVAEHHISPDRVALGWGPTDLQPAQLFLASSPEEAVRLAFHAPRNAIHICQGLRANGAVAAAQRALKKVRACQWVVMETVEDSGWAGVLKRFEYRRLISRSKISVTGYLASGYRTSDWLVQRGARADRVFPFAYFLTDPQLLASLEPAADGAPVRLLFVGQFIERKRLDLLIRVLKTLDFTNFELTVIGSGPQEAALRRLAETELGQRVRWLGQRPMEDIPGEMRKADCLILPSQHDGWGAVVSEALIVGTPAVCSDRCGAAGVVVASGHGGVFEAESDLSLRGILLPLILKGHQTLPERAGLARWAKSLCASAGAQYLNDILDAVNNGEPQPSPPWDRQR